MAEGVRIKHKRKAGAFTDGELAAGELGLDVSTPRWYFSVNGTTVAALPTSESTGDMEKSIYDSDEDGKVNAAVTADSIPWTGVSGKPSFGTASALNTGTTNGTIPVIGAGNKLPSSVIPAVALSSVQSAASQVAQLALTTEEGDVVVRTDTGRTYIKNAGTAGTMADFTEMPAIGVITSVNGQQGIVVIGKADVGLANVQNVDTTNAGNITTGNLPAAQMQTNVAAAINAASSTTINNSAITIDGGTI